MHADRCLKANSLTGKCESTDIAVAAIVIVPREYHTGSSQYVSAESEMKSDNLFGIELMHLGLSDTANLCDRVETVTLDPRSTATCAKEQMTTSMQGHLQKYLDEARERDRQDQREQA